MKKTRRAAASALLFLLLAASVCAAGLSEEEKALCGELNAAIAKIETLDNGVIVALNNRETKNGGIYADGGVAETFKFQKKDGEIRYLKRTTTTYSDIMEMKHVQGDLFVREGEDWIRVGAGLPTEPLAYYNGMTLRVNAAEIGKIEKSVQDGMAVYRVEQSEQWLADMSRALSEQNGKMEYLSQSYAYTVDSAGVLIRRVDTDHQRAQRGGVTDERRGTSTLTLINYNDPSMEDIR